MRTFIFASLCALLLLGCQSRFTKVYKIDIQQGNALEAESVNKIQVGMSQDQVLFVLGTPIIIDSFHPERWDYIYLFTPGYGEQQRRQLTLLFDRNEVIDIMKNNIVAEDSPLLEGEIVNNKKNSDKAVLDENQEKLEQDVKEMQDMLEKNKDANL